MPHIVVQPAEVRTAIVDPDGSCREAYLPVRFVRGPRDYQLGDTADMSIELMYFPRLRYEDVVPDATFTIREGAKIVGYGTVLSRNRDSLE